VVAARKETRGFALGDDSSRVVFGGDGIVLFTGFDHDGGVSGC
jgi:hypothetical protein